MNGSLDHCVHALTKSQTQMIVALRRRMGYT